VLDKRVLGAQPHLRPSRPPPRHVPELHAGDEAPRPGRGHVVGDRHGLRVGHRLALGHRHGGGVLPAQPPRGGADDVAAAGAGRRLQQLDGAAGPQRADPDRRLLGVDHPEDVEAHLGQLQVLARLVALQLVDDEPGDRRHVLLAVRPGPLHVDRRLVEPVAEVAVVGVGVCGQRHGASIGKRHTGGVTTSISDLARQHAPAWARVAREVLDTPYPYASGHVALGPDDTDVTPHRLHPAFHGALDWHSSVHMQWSLLTLLDRYDEALAEAGEAGPALRVLCRRLTEARLAAEVDYLWSRPAFERPYGWAWAAMLVAAAYRSERAESTGWAIALEPLGEVIAQHTVDWLPRQVYPVRHGKHQNDAFALALLLQAFGELGREDVVAAVRRRALEWFGHDTSYDTRTEPSGTDFLSPALCEAELMRRVLPAGEFRAWLAGFLPGLGEGAHPQLLGVPEIRDATDG